MATLNDVVIRVQSLLGSDPSLSSTEVESMAQARYEHIYETFLWSLLAPRLRHPDCRTGLERQYQYRDGDEW